MSMAEFRQKYNIILTLFRPKLSELRQKLSEPVYIFQWLRCILFLIYKKGPNYSVHQPAPSRARPTAQAKRGARLWAAAFPTFTLTRKMPA